MSSLTVNITVRTFGNIMAGKKYNYNALNIIEQEPYSDILHYIVAINFLKKGAQQKHLRYLLLKNPGLNVRKLEYQNPWLKSIKTHAKYPFTISALNEFLSELKKIKLIGFRNSGYFIILKTMDNERKKLRIMKLLNDGKIIENKKWRGYVICRSGYPEVTSHLKKNDNETLMSVHNKFNLICKEMENCLIRINKTNGQKLDFILVYDFQPYDVDLALGIGILFDVAEQLPEFYNVVSEEEQSDYKKIQLNDQQWRRLVQKKIIEKVDKID